MIFEGPPIGSQLLPKDLFPRQKGKGCKNRHPQERLEKKGISQFFCKRQAKMFIKIEVWALAEIVYLRGSLMVDDLDFRVIIDLFPFLPDP